jgi:hypothetical protein
MHDLLAQTYAAKTSPPSKICLQEGAEHWPPQMEKPCLIPPRISSRTQLIDEPNFTWYTDGKTEGSDYNFSCSTYTDVEDESSASLRSDCAKGTDLMPSHFDSNCKNYTQLHCSELRLKFVGDCGAHAGLSDSGPQRVTPAAGPTVPQSGGLAQLTWEPHTEDNRWPKRSSS